MANIGVPLDAETTRRIAKKLQQLMPGRAYILLTTEFSAQGIVSYVSNVQRQDAILALESFLASLKKQDTIPPQGVS